jgi:hypothetical protein
MEANPQVVIEILQQRIGALTVEGAIATAAALTLEKELHELRASLEAE